MIKHHTNAELAPIDNYIKLFPQLVGRGWLSREPDFRIFVAILFGALLDKETKTCRGKSFKLESGQWVFTLSELAKLVNVNRSAVVRSLKMLESEHVLIIQRSKQGVLVTICNWEFYQEHNGVQSHNIATICKPDENVDYYLGKYRSPSGANLDNPIFRIMADQAVDIIKQGLHDRGSFLSMQTEKAWLDIIKKIMAELSNSDVMEKLGLKPPIDQHVNWLMKSIVSDRKLLDRYGNKPWFVLHDYPQLFAERRHTRVIQVKPEQLEEENRIIARQRADRLAVLRHTKDRSDE